METEINTHQISSTTLMIQINMQFLSEFEEKAFWV